MGPLCPGPACPSPWARTVSARNSVNPRSPSLGLTPGHGGYPPFIARECLGSPDREAMSDKEGASEEDWLALRPQEPSPAQCCGSGCKPCIYDVYEKELAQWERAKATQDKSLLMGKKEQSNNSELNPDTFTAFSVSSVEQLTEDTYQYKFELPGNSSLRLSLGQHIVLRGVVDGLEVQRAYTPISPRNAEGYFEVLIKCYEAGLMSQYIKTWKRGDVVFWRGPFGGFPYQPNKETSLEKLPWSYQENTYTGHLNEDLMKTIVNSCRRKPFVLICGSSAFNEDMNRYLKAAGIEEDSCFVF